ncbi:GMC family oxidoreductase N-terminal domain-containing protein [Paraburkholderia sp. C35]|uniref:GMC family oxidoreductase n=1 Tax=Paraburkholderia sp. C35 TaxID=2126993 RepID=UPI000D690B60|nr:GMC family oxidoreductase N-terminal domain-containing protein [Paraburkholderia sp. C35]
MEFDFMIIGGGTAGTVMASRLSENHKCRVILVEAGDDISPGAVPADVQDAFPASSLNPNYFWKDLAAKSADGAPPAPYPQARVMGGGSSINGMFALRGVPSDYARWADAGAGNFSWDTVLPYFRKVESDRDRVGISDGPHPISRTPKAQWPAFVRAMEQAARRAGLPFIDDINEQPGDGFFSMPVALDADTRVTSAGSYLSAEVRARPNLEILPNTQVTRLRMMGDAVSGVDAVRDDGTTIQLNARHVIVSAGGIYSPTILLRSGIGPAEELTTLGIPVSVDLPGVGRNLQNHPYMFFALTLPRGKRIEADLRRFAVAGLRASSRVQGCPAGDLFAFVIGRVSGESFGPDFALVGTALYAPKSRGFVKLSSADPRVNPDINFRFMSDPADPERMIRAARLTEHLLRDPSVATQYNEAFLLPGALSMKQFNRPGFAGKALAMAAGLAAGSPGPIRRTIFGRAFKSGKAAVFAGGGRQILDEELLSSICPMGHPVGTCSMGNADDPMAVVDNEFRVHGASNLFVVDASVMPVITSANTNLPTLMLAEVAAERIAARWCRL